jgi:hypothetical protein
VENFRQFVKNIFKKNILSQIPCLKKIIAKKKKEIEIFAKNRHNCLQQYERVLKILYFHILNMAICLAKFIYGLLPLEQHHKIEKRKEKLAWG